MEIRDIATKGQPISLSTAEQTPIEKTGFSNGRMLAGLIAGDAVEGLKQLPNESVHVVVTSPPYFWARDYEVDGQIGHEDTVKEYVERLVEVFNEVHRVLHPQGVFYLNIGDAYYSGRGQPRGSDPRSTPRKFMRKKWRALDRPGWDIPKKSLIGIPWKVAFALQEQGWILRSDIIWNRYNSCPEPSASDRPHRRYEHLFLFSKSRFYSYDRSQLGGEEDVWNIPIEPSKSSLHNAQFPSALVRRCILTGSPNGGIVLDPFVGSGTTIMTALELERNAIGIDLSPKYIRSITNAFEPPVWQQIDWQHLGSKLLMACESCSYWYENKTSKKNHQKR